MRVERQHLRPQHETTATRRHLYGRHRLSRYMKYDGRYMQQRSPTTTPATTGETILFTRGVPPVEAFPTDQLAECFNAVLHNDGAVILQYGHQPGYPALRQLLAAEYGVSEQEVLIGNGSLQLQDLIARHLAHSGQTILTEQPSYDRAISTFRRHASRTIGIPLEDDGIDVEKLTAAVEQQVPALVYLIPDFQNPAGATLSLEKRHAIVELADKYGFWIIEDVPYRKLRYRGTELPLLRDIDPTHVMTLSSFSKLLSPGIRVGYMIAPREMTESITRHAEAMYLAPVLPTQAVVAEFMRRGWLEPNIAHLRDLYRPRWEAMLKATQRYLSGARVTQPDGGFFISATLPADANTTNLIGRAKEQGLILTHGHPFFADSDQSDAGEGERFVRLPFCAVTPEQIDEGVRRLASLL